MNKYTFYAVSSRYGFKIKPISRLKAVNRVACLEVNTADFRLGKIILYGRGQIDFVCSRIEIVFAKEAMILFLFIKENFSAVYFPGYIM